MYADHTMLNDAVRLARFREAIQARVQPGDVVLDAGTGVGVLAVMAVQAGASHVFAVDNRGIIGLARSVAEANGCADRITFIQGDMRDVRLPEPAHGVVCEQLGYAGLAEGIGRLLERVMQRHVRPGGWCIPHRMTVFAAPVQDHALYGQLMLHCCAPGLDMDPVREEIAQNYWVELLSGSEFLAPPRDIMRMAWGAQTADQPAEPAFAIERAGALHGFGAWFTADLAPGVTLDTGPQAPPTSWRQVFFPLRHPLAVQPGDTLSFVLTTLPLPQGDMFHWRYALSRNGNTVAEAAHTNALTYHAHKAFSGNGS